MRRLTISSIIGLLLVAATTTGALAAKPAPSCPPEASGYFSVDIDTWWEITVEGFETEGIPVYEADGVTYTEEFDAFAAAFGFGDGAGLEGFVRGPQWDKIDRNGNGLACMKRRATTPGVGNPAYFFNGVDDRPAPGQG
ncbi:MAG: hypothetical protein ACRDZU_15325 [Acidimicrobiales bacterium]